MNKKHLYRLVTTLAALSVAGLFLAYDFGLGVSPLTKFFVVFLGAIIGLQSIPATLLFVDMIKGTFKHTDASRPVRQQIKQEGRS